LIVFAFLGSNERCAVLADYNPAGSSGSGGAYSDRYGPARQGPPPT
jgi:hypothetical protein